MHDCSDWRGGIRSTTTSAAGGGEGASDPGDSEQGRHLEERKYEILKFGRFGQIAICITDSDIIHPLIPTRTTPQLSVVHDPTQSSVYTKKLHC